MRRQILARGGRCVWAGLVLVLLMVIPAATQEPGPRFSAWTQAVAVGPPLRVPGWYEACPFIAKGDLDLYFRKEVYVPATDTYQFDIYVVHRDGITEPWGTPVSLGAKINTPASNELCSFVTIDGHWLYFVSNRNDAGVEGGNYGAFDIFVSHRKDKDDPAGWEKPVNLGPYVNTAVNENGPSIFEDEATGKIVMYFTRAVSGKNKIFQTGLLDWDNPGPASQVPGLNAEGASDWHAFIRRRDGLEVVFASNRGGLPQSDLFVSTRPTTSSPWSTPVNLGPLVNDAARQEGRPSISWDGATLYFWTDRERYTGPEGSWWDMHVYKTTRTRITGKDK